MIGADAEPKRVHVKAPLYVPPRIQMVSPAWTMLEARSAVDRFHGAAAAVASRAVRTDVEVLSLGCGQKKDQSQYLFHLLPFERVCGL